MLCGFPVLGPRTSPWKVWSASVASAIVNASNLWITHELAFKKHRFGVESCHQGHPRVSSAAALPTLLGLWCILTPSALHSLCPQALPEVFRQGPFASLTVSAFSGQVPSKRTASVASLCPSPRLAAGQNVCDLKNGSGLWSRPPYPPGAHSVVVWMPL